VRTSRGVVVVGASNLAATMPAAASAAYSHNITALTKYMVVDGSLRIGLDDEIQLGVVITYGGRVVQAATLAVLSQSSPQGGAR
jgi:NAD(P) transhydrogenase subunit alpha